MFGCHPIPLGMFDAPSHVCERCGAVQYVGRRGAHESWCPSLPPRSLEEAATELRWWPLMEVDGPQSAEAAVQDLIDASAARHQREIAAAFCELRLLNDLRIPYRFLDNPLSANGWFADALGGGVMTFRRHPSPRAGR
jgi:hypothetical protein